MATEAEAKETISESQHIVQGPFCETLHPDAVGMSDISKSEFLVETPIDSQLSFKETVPQNVNIVSEEFTSKESNNRPKDEKVSEVKEPLVSEIVEGNVTTTDEGSGNKRDAQAADKQEEAQGGTDNEKLERANEELNIKLEHESRSVNDESSTGTDNISGAKPLQNDNSIESDGMMTREELIPESPLDQVNEKPEAEMLDGMNEDLHAKIQAGTNDSDGSLAEKSSEKGYTQETFEITAKDKFGPTKDEPEHGALESSRSAVHDKTEESERVSEEKNAKIEDEAEICDDERANHADSILAAEKENKHEQIDVAATRDLGPSEDVPEHDKLASPLDAIPGDLKGLKGKGETDTMSKEDLVMNVDGRCQDDEQKCEPMEKAAFELLTVSEATWSETCGETLAANKTNEKNTDDEVEETTEGCQMHEEISSHVGANIDQPVQETEPENLDKVPETMLKDHSHEKFDDAENTDFGIPENGVCQKEEIDTSCTSKAAIEENTGKTMNTEETSELAQPNETNEVSQHIVQGPFYETLHPDAVGMSDMSKSKFLVETPIDSQLSFKKTIPEHVNIISEESASKESNNRPKDDKVTEVKEPLASETVEGNVMTTNEEMATDESSGNKVDAQAADKQEEAQGGTDNEKLERAKEEPSIKLEHESRSVNDESSTGSDNISGAKPSQNENSIEAVGMMTQEELIPESPLDQVNEKPEPEPEMLDGINEDLHAQIQAGTEISYDKRTNDSDSALAEKLSEKGEDFGPRKDEAGYGAFESSRGAVHDETEESERVNEEKNAKIEGEARICDDERANHADSILATEKENKHEPIDVATTRDLEPSEDVQEHDILESPLDAVPGGQKGLKGKGETDTMNKEGLVMNVDERCQDDEQKCEPMEKAAFELLTVSEATMSEMSGETLAANKTNEKNTDEVEETAEGYEMHEEISSHVGTITEPDNLERVPETMLKDQSHKKFDDAENTNFGIPEDGTCLKKEIDSSCTSKAVIEENTGKTMNTEETSELAQPDEKNEASQHIIQGPFYETLHLDAIGMSDISKSKFLVETPIDSQLSFKETVPQHANIVSEENRQKDEEVSEVKEPLVSETVERNVMTTEEGMAPDESSGNKVQAVDKQEEAQGGTDNEKLERANEEPSIKLKHESRSVNDESRTGIDNTSGARPLQNENSKEPVGMMTTAELIPESPLDQVNEKPEAEMFDGINEDLHAKIQAGTGILNDKRTNDSDRALVEKHSEKGEDFGPVEDEAEHGALESSRGAVHDKTEESERVNEEKNAKIEGEAGICDDERANHADNILATEKENKHEPIDVAATRDLEPSEDVPEHDKLKSPLDAVPEDLRGLKGKGETDTMSKEEQVVNVDERCQDDEKKCEPIEKAAFELLTVSEATLSETSSETLAANKTNEKNTDDEVKETTEGCEMREEISSHVGANIDQTVQETEPENLEKVPETMLKDQSHKKSDVAENTDFGIPEDDICKENTGKTMNTEDSSELAQPDEQNEAGPEIADHIDDPATTSVKDEGVLEKTISDVSGTHAFVAEAADKEKRKKNENDHPKNKTEDDKEAAGKEEKKNLDINREVGPEILKGDMCETDNTKIERALSLDEDANGSYLRVEIASDETLRLNLEAIAVESDDKLETSDVFNTGGEEAPKKDESVENIMTSRTVNTNSAEAVSENQKEVKEGAAVTANSEIIGGEEKQKLEGPITEVVSRDQSKEIYDADDNRMNETTIEEISEKVEPNKDIDTVKNKANENKEFDEQILSVQETLKGEEGQNSGERLSSVNEDPMHQSTYTKENIDVDVPEAERETEQLRLRPKSLHEDKWQKEAGVFDVIKIDCSTNDDNPSTTVSVVANPNEDFETATKNDETSLNTEKEDHSDCQRMILPVLSDQIGEHESASTAEHKEHICHAKKDEGNIDIDVQKEKAQSEELKTIMEYIPDDCNQENFNRPKATDISYNSEDLGKEIPEISSHNDDPETAEVKDEDVLEKGICDVSDTHELVAEVAYDGVDEKHEDSHQITNTEDNKEATVQNDEEIMDISSDLQSEDQRQDAVCEAERVKAELALNIDKDDKGFAIGENASKATSGLTLEETLEEKNYKLEYDDKTESNMSKIREVNVPAKELFDACLGVSSNAVAKEPTEVEVKQVSPQITEKEEGTNDTVEEGKDAKLVSQPNMESMENSLHTNEASLDKKMQDVSVAVLNKIHSAEEDDGIEVRAILENQIKEEKEVHISSQKDEMEDNQQEKEKGARAEQKSYESSATVETVENESFKDKETTENDSEEEKLEDSNPETSPTVVLEDFETATVAKDIHESETHKQCMKNISEEIFQKAEDMMLTESVIELEPGSQSNSSIHTNEETSIPSTEELKEEVLGAYLGVSSNFDFNEPSIAEIEHSAPHLTDKVEARNGTEKEAKDAELLSQMDIKTMVNTLEANEDSHDMNTREASVGIADNIQSTQEDDSIEVGADSSSETKEEKDAHKNLIKEHFKDMPQEKEIQREQGSYKSREACETNECESFGYKETSEDTAINILEDQDAEILPCVIEDPETASETEVIHVSETEKQSTENDKKGGILKDEDVILVQSVTELEHDTQNNKPIHSSEGPIPSVEALKEEAFEECMGVSTNTSLNDHTATDIEHLPPQITEKEEVTTGTHEEAEDDELISRTDVETVVDSLYVREAFHDKNMQDASVIVKEKIQRSSEDNSTEITGIPEIENKEEPDAHASTQYDEPEDKKHEKDDELTSQMDIDTAGDSIYANKDSNAKNMQNVTELVEEKIQRSSEDNSTEITSIPEIENKDEPDAHTSTQDDEPEDKKQEKDDELISQMDIETAGDSIYANKDSNAKNMQHAPELVEEKIPRSSEDNSTEIMGIPEIENKEPNAQTSLQELEDKKQENGDELTSQMDIETAGDTIYANEASDDSNMQGASDVVEDKMRSSSDDKSTKITDIPEIENKEPDAQRIPQDNEPKDKKQEKDDELAFQTDIETAYASSYAYMACEDKNMQDASEVVEDKTMSSSEDKSRETMSMLENENKESMQKEEPECKKQEKENDVQAAQKCYESWDASDTIENETLEEKVVAINSSQKEMTDHQEPEKFPRVVHGNLKTTRDKATDVPGTEQEGAENKNEENIKKYEYVMPVESVIKLEHGNQGDNPIYTVKEAPIHREEGVCGNGLSETTVADIEHLTQQVTEEEEETNGTDEGASLKHAEDADLSSQMGVQTVNNNTSPNEASFDTKTQDASEEIEERVHSTKEDSSIQIRAIAKIESIEEKDVRTSLKKEEFEDKPPPKENEIQKEQVANESNEASEQNEYQSFKDKVSAENYSEKDNLELHESETVTETVGIHESETDKQREEPNNEENFQKVEGVTLVEPMFKLEHDGQDNKPSYTADIDIPEEETLKVFNACVEEASNIEFTKPIVDKVENLSQQLTKEGELINEEVDAESTFDALCDAEASHGTKMQDASVVVEEKILDTPEDNSVEVREVFQNGNKEKQGVHTVLQKEELKDKPVEIANEIEILQKSYKSCDASKTNEKENIKGKETEEHNLEKEILEEQGPEKSPHVIDKDIETTRTECFQEGEAEKKGTENNSEECFQKAEDLMVPESTSRIEPESDYSNHSTEIEIPNEETLKDEAFDACQYVSSNTGTKEPFIAEEHLSLQIIDKHETSNDTYEKDKEVMLVSEMNMEARSVHSLQVNVASVDRNLQDSSLAVEEKIHSSSEHNSIEVTAFSKNGNKGEEDVEESLHEEEQEDKLEENEIEIQAEQKFSELSNTSETIENESLNEKATKENKLEKEKLEDQESKCPNVVHEETETAIGTEAIHDNESEKQVIKNNNGENFLKGEDMMFAESVTELDIGYEINKSIHTTEPEIPSEETLKEVFDACQEVSFYSRPGKPIVAEVEHPSQHMAAKEAAANKTNEVDKNGKFVSQTDVEPMGDTSCFNEVSLEMTMQETSEVVEENISMSDGNQIFGKAILEDEIKEEHAIHTSSQKEDLEAKSQEKENEVLTEKNLSALSDANKICETGSKERESAKNNSEKEKLEDQESEKSSQMVLEDLEAENETEDIHGSETEKQETERVIESEADNTNNNSIHSTKGVGPTEDKAPLFDDVAKVDARNEGNCYNMLSDISMAPEWIEESKQMEGQRPIQQKNTKEIETHQEAEQSASAVAQNKVTADSSEILSIKLQKDVNEFMEFDASSDTLFRNQEVTTLKNIVSDEDTIEAVCEQIQKDEIEAKKDELNTHSVSNNPVKENNRQSLKQTTTMMDSSGNLGTSLIMTSLADETEKEVEEKFSKISDYWPARYHEEASNVNAVDREHQKEITCVIGQTFGIEKFTFTSDSTDDSKLDACKERREMLNEVSKLESKEEVDEKIGSSTVVTENKENPHEQSAMEEAEEKQPVVKETQQGINDASHEVKVDNLQEEETDLPVSQFLMKHILGEEVDTHNKICEEDCGDITNKQEERETRNEVDIPKPQEISRPADNAGYEKFQGSYEAQTEESSDAENNSEGTVPKVDVSLQSALEGSTSKLAVIEDAKDEIASLSSAKSVHTATDDSMELISAEKRIPQFKLDAKPCNENDLVQDEKIYESVFQEAVAEKDILRKESGKESKEQLQCVGNAEVSEDKIGEILKIGSEVVEYGQEKQDVGTQMHTLQNDSEEEIKISKSQKEKQTDLAIESTIHSLERDENLMEVKNLAVLVETTDDKGGVNKTDEGKCKKEETDEHKPDRSSNDITTMEATDSELKLIHNDDQTEKTSESSITKPSDPRSQNKNEDSEDKKQDVIDQNQMQMKNGTSVELKPSESQIVQQSDFAVIEDNSVPTTESKVDEHKTDDEDDEKEEEGEDKPEEPGHGATMIVEGRDAEVTPRKKKSHGILSGVGSKVKHSIAKVKKVITGKSSHSKTPPAK